MTVGFRGSGVGGTWSRTVMKSSSSWTSRVSIVRSLDDEGSGGGGVGGPERQAATRSGSTRAIRRRPRIGAPALARRPPRWPAAAALVVVASGCVPRSLLERAIAARGGPLRTLVRRVEADVRIGFPGRWEARTVLLVPDRYALTIETATEADHYLFDGATMRAFIGDAPVAVERNRASALASQARFAAVVNLDALR